MDSKKPLFVVAASLALTFGLTAHAEAGEFHPVLDKQQQLDQWSWRDNRDDAWFEKEIPFFESPDRDIDETYYYRWELITKHMVYTGPENGYVLTEFIHVGPISCAMGHHIYETRWLKDRRVPEDYIKYWSTPGAMPRSYSNWYADAVWADYLVNNDRDFLLGRLPSMEAQYQGWLNERWDANHQMFHWSGMHDGMEYTIASRQTNNGFDGGDSYRPTLNSYVYGDLLATASVEDLAGNPDKAASYRSKAAALKTRLEQELWDPKRQFFIGQFFQDYEKDGYTVKANSLIYQSGKYAGDSHGRELSGYAPWYFNLPDPGKGYEQAWKGVTDPAVFFAPYGLYFTERHDPMFMIAPAGCAWSGNNWPYADSLVLGGMANVLDNYPQNVITKEDYFKVLKAYTLGQRKDGRPYIAECSDPGKGVWTQDSPNSSDDYFHSSYNDLIITGLAGLRPRADNTVEVQPLAPDSWDYFCLDDVPYHGHRLSIVWDKTGLRYGRGKGLSILADGQAIANRPDLGKLEGTLPPLASPVPPVDRPINFAASKGQGLYPWITASTTALDTSPGNLVDGVYYYNRYRPLNRWTTEGSTSSQEWLQVDFGRARPVETVKLYLLDDGPVAPVRVPAALTLQTWDGNTWNSVPDEQRNSGKLEGHQPAVFTFPTPVLTSRLRVLMTPQPGAAVGLTEFEAWGHAPLPLPQPGTPEGDLALNAQASASFTGPDDRVAAINDGKIDMRGGSRWTDYSSHNATDWVQLDFPQPTTIGRLMLCLWADGGGVRIPDSFSIHYWNGSDWTSVSETARTPAIPTGAVPNVVLIQPIITSKIRVTFVPNSPGKSGLSELMAFEK